MTSLDAVLGGGFALAGVIVQQIGSGVSARATHGRERAVRLSSEKRDAYARLIVEARTVQRLSKDQADGLEGSHDRVRIEECLGALAQANAEIRLLGSSDIIQRALNWEDTARRRMLSGDISLTDQLRIGPLVEAMRRDLPGEGAL